MKMSIVPICYQLSVEQRDFVEDGLMEMLQPLEDQSYPVLSEAYSFKDAAVCNTFCLVYRSIFWDLWRSEAIVLLTPQKEVLNFFWKLIFLIQQIIDTFLILNSMTNHGYLARLDNCKAQSCSSVCNVAINPPKSLYELLCELFRANLAYEYIPQAWRLWRIIFIPKKG